jgi:hypothetical protein
MRTIDQAPSIAPDIYLRPARRSRADHDSLIRNLMDGQYRHPVRIVAFNTAEGWSRDVTLDIADELRRRLVGVPRSVQAFVEAASRTWLKTFTAAKRRVRGVTDLLAVGRRG